MRRCAPTSCGCASAAACAPPTTISICSAVVRFVSLSADDPQLEAFYRGIYWDAFAAQHEPLDVWRAALLRDALADLAGAPAVFGEIAIDRSAARPSGRAAEIPDDAGERLARFE